MILNGEKIADIIKKERVKKGDKIVKKYIPTLMAVALFGGKVFIVALGGKVF